MNKKILLIGAVVFVLIIVLVAARRTFHGWSIDLANTAWGAIIAAMISGIIGVVLKSAMDLRLAALQGHVQKDVQIAIEAELTIFQETLTTLKATLDDSNSARSARRDYEYEARKRLYSEIEPLMFQIYESLDEAHHRVLSLARTSRNNELEWLEKDGYYLISTVYKLLLPVANLKLVQQRMTFVDLGLDPQIELLYLLLKLYTRSFTDDFIFAKILPVLVYKPNDPDWPQKRIENPAIYWRQALLVGNVDSIADLLISREDDKSRAMSYGEFEGLFRKSVIDHNLREVLELFRGFSPEYRPVLSRLLVAQGCMSKFILSVYHYDVMTDSLQEHYDNIIDKKFTNELYWGDNKDDSQVVSIYWKEKLKILHDEISIRRSISD